MLFNNPTTPSCFERALKASVSALELSTIHSDSDFVREKIAKCQFYQTLVKLIEREDDFQINVIRTASLMIEESYKNRCEPLVIQDWIASWDKLNTHNALAYKTPAYKEAGKLLIDGLCTEDSEVAHHVISEMFRERSPSMFIVDALNHRTSPPSAMIDIALSRINFAFALSSHENFNDFPNFGISILREFFSRAKNTTDPISKVIGLLLIVSCAAAIDGGDYPLNTNRQYISLERLLACNENVLTFMRSVNKAVCDTEYLERAFVLRSRAEEIMYTLGHREICARK